MAVPKKRTSKSKKNLRKTEWKRKASVEAKKALGKAKMVLNSLLNKNSLDTTENAISSDSKND